MRALLIVWLVLVHVVAIILFTRGFLLTRRSLDNVSIPYTPTHAPKPTHKRAVVLIIDALRFDFVSPNPPSPPDPFHHNVLTLPRELTAERPEHSFLFNSYADPPTTTLQRIKALTTGSLPTFVDMGSNFGASAILEDSLIKQLQLANKTIAFMGDDTWLSVFPDSFHPNLTFPYDSFNVEDLHTVDTGVLTHLFPLLLNQHPNALIPKHEDHTADQFDVLIGHFLGVDHVGHRLGPSHPLMHAKLTQMDTALRRVIDCLSEDTLLVVLGDHGMDRAGDHGGDGVLETSAALWLYSKGPPLTQVLPEGDVPSGLLKYKTFPGATVPHRTVQQIDLVPSLALLLGLPVPYNNLGSIIPELFWRRSSDGRTELEKALIVNSQQVHDYLLTYRGSPAGSELDTAWGGLENTWDALSLLPKLTTGKNIENRLVALTSYTRAAVSACRTIWAQFDALRMGCGLAVMLAGLLSSWLVYWRLSTSISIAERKKLLAHMVPSIWKMALLGGSCAAALWFAAQSVFPRSLLKGLDTRMNSLEAGMFGAIMLGSVICIVPPIMPIPADPSPPSPSAATQNTTRFKFTPAGIFATLLVCLHTISFFSNSFTFWEDKIVLWLAVTSVVPLILVGLRAPGARRPSASSRSVSDSEPSSSSNSTRWPTNFNAWQAGSLQGRILSYLFLFLVCIRLMSLVSVCREEQGPYCHVTFYATPSSASAATVSSSIPSLNLTNAEVALGSTSSPPPLAAPIATSTTPPTWALVLALPMTLLLPYTITRVLRIARADVGIASPIIWSFISPCLLGSYMWWILEWVETGGIVEGVVQVIEGFVRLRTVRSWLARSVFAWDVFGLVTWWMVPVCLDIRISSPASSSSQPRQQAQGHRTQITILGYANAYGAPYLLFYLLCFVLVYLCTPLPGQVVLGLGLVAFLSYLEALDAIRDVTEMERKIEKVMQPKFTPQIPTKEDGTSDREEQKSDEEEEEPTRFADLLPLILLGFITFYGTGHQSTVSSIQWKAGFVLSESVKYPWSVLTVLANSLGAFWLLGIGTAIIGLWKREPKLPPAEFPGEHKGATRNSEEEQEETGSSHVLHSAFLSTLAIQLYFFALLFGVSLSAALLRRHLMVWKVFAPRFMTGVVEMIILDVGVLIVWGFAVPVSQGDLETGMFSVLGRITDRVAWVFGKLGMGRKKELKEE